MKTFKKLKSKNIFLIKIHKLIRMSVIGFVLLQLNLFAQDQNCLDCHETMVEKKFIHGPVDADCTFCHEPNGEEHPNDSKKGFTIAYTGSELCYSCHTEHHDANTTNKTVHAVIADGACLDCHEVHSSDQAKLINTKLPDLCNMCHYEIEEAVTGKAVVHMPLQDDDGCVLCHSAHSSKEANLLLYSEKELCLNCHSLEDAKVQHAPLEDGCVTCHDPHASAIGSLLKMNYPSGNYANGKEENYELCYTCHDVEALTLASTSSSTNFRNGKKNLHYLHVNKDKGRTCTNCHNVHGSQRLHLIAETVKFGRWDMPLNYIPTENGGSCSTGCHRDWKYDRTKLFD